MSLTVKAYRRNAEGGLEFVAADPGEELAGFESCRRGLWGHAAVRVFGISLLSSLVAGDIHAEGEALNQLEKDVQHVLENLSDIAEVTGFGEEFITHRSQNILAAIRRAREVGGGVAIC